MNIKFICIYVVVSKNPHFWIAASAFFLNPSNYILDISSGEKMLMK